MSKFEFKLQIKYYFLISIVDEEVDEDAFRNLNEEIIRRLIPKAGPQIKFLTKWKKEFGTIIDPVGFFTYFFF